MPAVPLDAVYEDGRTLPTADGGLIHLHQRRLLAWVTLGTDHVIHRAVVDTGAPTCIFRKETWKKLHGRGQIEWVCHPPGTAAVDALPRTTFLGGTYPFRLGRVSLRIVGAKVGDELSPVPVLVQCTEDTPVMPDDPPALPPLLLIGLEGVLNGRTLTVTASADGTAWAASLAE
jgi:hypothetical protein